VGSEQLSENFALAEFERDGAMPADAIPSYHALCTELLEPIRAQFGRPIEITSGYRSPESNAAAHGVSHSQHVATANYCAADFYVAGTDERDMRPVFDWIRLASGLAFDQLILEHGSGGDIVHISWAKAFQRREALEGATHNQTAYTPWPVEGSSA
jgi:zinc D-Ala-D-Ala carboxypeptidase